MLPTYPIQSNDIVVALTGVELDGKATRITSSVRELTADSDSGEAEEERSLATN